MMRVRQDPADNVTWHEFVNRTLGDSGSSSPMATRRAANHIIPVMVVSSRRADQRDDGE
jgi:hypothetical protein